MVNPAASIIPSIGVVMLVLVFAIDVNGVQSQSNKQPSALIRLALFQASRD